MASNQRIGIFDSGYGGLTVFRSIMRKIPDYDYIYLGDNARAPYGDHAFETVHAYTLQCVEWLFAQGCSLVILACNTASAKALRTIQQRTLPAKYPDKRVLGVIRPTAECIGNYTRSGSIGIMGTRGTINSASYLLEIAHFFPKIQVWQQSCPMWVPLIENNEHLGEGADYFVKKYIDLLLADDATIDTILLACTHYPLLLPKISAFLPPDIHVVLQGDIVADSLMEYLQRHKWLEGKLSRDAIQLYYTTGEAESFDVHASLFFDKQIKSKHVTIG